MGIEIIGIVATVIILASNCFKTMTFWGSFWLRLLNVIGSAIFLVYGVLLPAISTAILNGALVVINLYHLIVLMIAHNKSKHA